MSILTFLGLGQPSQGPGAGESDAIRKIVAALDSMDEERARFIAAFGYLLGRVANADMNISAEETAEMERIIAAQGALTPEQAAVVVKMAKLRNELFGGTDNFLVTREFNRIATREQKLALLDCLFAVSASSEGISTVEDNQIRQITSELGLDHRDLVQIRLRWSEQRNVLKKPPS